jgi:hypothetical protein
MKFVLVFFSSFFFLSQVEAQSSSGALLAPDRRLASFTATTILPKNYVSLGSVSASGNLNFSVGDFLIGDPSLNIRNLVKSRLYLGANAEVQANVASIVWKSRKGTRTALGLGVSGLVDSRLDRDFLRIATEGILPEGFGQERISSKGVQVNAHVFSELYLHKVRTLSKTNFGYRIRMVTPVAGVQVATPEFRLNRVNDSSANSLELSYRFTGGTYGFDPQNIGGFEPNIGMLFSKNTSVLFDLGIEQEINAKLRVGISLQNLPGFLRIKDAEVTDVYGKVAFEGASFDLGSDSLSAVFDELLAFNLDSLIPKQDTRVGSLSIPIKPVVRIYGHRYLSEESFLSVSGTLRQDTFGTDVWTSVYLYSKPNKLFHIAYGLNWWTNNNTFDASVSGRMLLAPFTRLTLTMSNPFLLPRITPSGRVLVPENFSGFNLAIGLSFGAYKDEGF